MRTVYLPDDQWFHFVMFGNQMANKLGQNCILWRE